MKDVQNSKDIRGLDINEVGISDLKIPLIIGEGKSAQQIIPNTKMAVNLLSDFKGTHMSRFTEIAERVRGRRLNEKLLDFVLKQISEQFLADYAKVDFSFVYFITKKAPISKKTSSMNYKCKIGGEISNNRKKMCFFEIEIPVATLCPCSKEISESNAHNQRAIINLKVKSYSFISIEELIKQVENKASCELFSTLKRVDEKFVTEKMYNNPMFVEDIVREVTLLVKKDNRIKDYIVKCKSYESIHNHNAFAIIIHNKNDSN